MFMRRAARLIIILAQAALLTDCGESQSGKAAPPTQAGPPPRVENGILGTSVTFFSAKDGEPAALTLYCHSGTWFGDLAFKLDAPPEETPPLRGVVASISFPHEPRTLIELGYSADAFWMPRENEIGNVREITKRFIAGDEVEFTLPPPNGSGKMIKWSRPASFKMPKCP